MIICGFELLALLLQWGRIQEDGEPVGRSYCLCHRAPYRFIICKIMDIKELYALYRRCSCVTTDSRHCPENSLFIALKGASFDGNRFAAQALEKGCSYAVVDEPQYAVAGDARYIVVTDALTTYKELAREHRRQFDIPVIGITGTNGKTTTKELVSAVLAKNTVCSTPRPTTTTM